MEIRFQNLGPEQWNAQIAIALCCEAESLPDIYPDLDQACPWLAVAPALRDFHGKAGEIAILHGHPELKLPRVLACGLGPKEKVDLNAIRKALAKASRQLRNLGLTSALLPASILDKLPGGRQRLLEEIVYAFILGLYRFTELKTKKQDEEPDPAWLAIGLKNQDDSAEKAARKGENAAWAVCEARNLDNLPANLLYPEALALRAIALGQKHGFKCEVFDQDKLVELGAGCLLAVGQGASHPPRLIVLDYRPKGHEQEKPLILVGKGVTFDSGGICLKPAANMYQMKCDMSGAGAVLAAISAAALEKVERRVVGILACAENMPDGRAYRPGDILTSLAGDSVEVINTDAEGRLCLADALAYACKNYTPAAIIDIATLTGACAVALGNDLAGLFSSDDALAQRLSSYGAAAGENFWRLPLWPAYEDSLKSEIADIKHTASREGGAITAALFLQNFVTAPCPWAHLDIASVDWNSKDKPLCPEGPTGFGARTLLEICRGGAA